MPELSTLVLFIPAALALVLIPGPVVLYVVARSLRQGRRAGLASVLAAGVGNSCHVIAALLGLSALVASSAVAFSAVKYAGAAYLIYLGVRTLVSHEDRVKMAVPVPMAPRRIFYQGLLVSVLNPKTALFFLAFLPQFVNPSQGAVAVQVLVLGGLLVIMGMGTDSLYALLASSVGDRLRGRTRFSRGQRYVAGGVYLALGATTAFTGSQKR